MASVVLATEAINDFDAFHTECARAFGFPGFYGRNMDAWIDCLSHLHLGDGLSSIALATEEQLFVHLPEFEALSQRAKDVCSAMLECAAFE